ncbi:glutamine-hydrolyzing GMP synthase [Chitinophaga pinensis]|uniref:GMP synthase [glutamine-hydrolyzing] n=1 Tax=Chitinophaga pinensis TaxID=79329 RepID=A0A5C6LXN0_9BACT|nr:glutamine-hydrolyzing GMP synthase [Chitinophaga pinensis]TWW01981.1 glutamine-hydrolyzing GMP synthase [Chitinophaga pinensis]
MTEKILILDFGSQYTQLIARSIRELNIYCEIKPCLAPIQWDDTVKGIILSGSPFSVNDAGAPTVDIAAMAAKVPVLGVCYGAQLTAKVFGGEVAKSSIREYGRAFMDHGNKEEKLLYDISSRSQVWMSHSDTIVRMPEGFEIIAHTDNIPVAAFKSETVAKHPILGLQFHPEVTHSLEGKQLLRNFLVHICGCTQDWTPAAFVQETIDKIKAQVGNKKVVMALSGGVDSTVAAELIHKAIGSNLYCIFVDNGLLRKNEFENVLDSYKHMGLNVKGVNAKDLFYGELNGVSDPEKKRKIIGRLFIEVFQQEANLLKDISFLGQGTIYPDVIESVSVNGPSVTIKSHHNVGGLPEKMNMGLVEPLRFLFKDEVRRVGREIGISEIFLGRHPFPGPGLAIRILGEITPEKVAMLQEADAVYIDGLREAELYDKVWQAGTILLPVQSVGVMGDERTYEFTVALRAVTSVDGMTADWAHLPYEFLAKMSNDIINKVKGINRVVYDISSKPPATIEWE